MKIKPVQYLYFTLGVDLKQFFYPKIFFFKETKTNINGNRDIRWAVTSCHFAQSFY